MLIKVGLGFYFIILHHNIVIIICCFLLNLTHDQSLQKCYKFVISPIIYLNSYSFKFFQIFLHYIVHFKFLINTLINILSTM